VPPLSAGGLRGSSALRRPFRRREGGGTSPARSWRVDRVGLGVWPSVVSVSAVATAANKGASDPASVACVAAAVDGSGSRSSNRGWRGGGGGDPDVDFVLWLRRRGGARSGVPVEPRSLYRSGASATLHPQLQALPSSSSRLVAGVGGEDFDPVLLQPDAALSCWYGETEADDFPCAMNPSADAKFTLAPGGSSGGGAPARPRLALELVLGCSPRDLVVIFCFHGVCCTGFSPP
jgi:hypothetical protein